jgi:hypothetical protein
VVKNQALNPMVCGSNTASVAGREREKMSMISAEKFHQVNVILFKAVIIIDKEEN